LVALFLRNTHYYKSDRSHSAGVDQKLLRL